MVIQAVYVDVHDRNPSKGASFSNVVDRTGTAIVTILGYSWSHLERCRCLNKTDAPWVFIWIPLCINTCFLIYIDPPCLYKTSFVEGSLMTYRGKYSAIRTVLILHV